MKLGSLFDGSGGFPLAGALCGITPVWASEVEPYPIAVTRSRFPQMRHIGDVSKVSGAGIELVDIITFGSPCQDLSVAGKRAGLKHTENGDKETTRSGLFMEAVRIIKEMRKASGNTGPDFAVWENVPGAFSSNKGEDFRIVLEELAKVTDPEAVVPRPPKGKWPKEGSIMGDGWSLAWRTMDAQYWGVPQRRRRIYLVADFRGERAGKVLFKREGLRGYFEEGRSPWKTTPTDAGGGPAATDREGKLILNDQGGSRISAEYDICPTLRAEAHGNLPCVLSAAGFREGQSMAGRIGWQEGCAATLSAHCSGTEPTVCVVYRKGTRPHSADEAQKWEEGDVANTLNTFDIGEQRASEIVVYAIAGNVVDRDAKQNGSGVTTDIAYTLNTVDRHAVAYSIGNGQPDSLRMEKIAKTLDCMHDAQAIIVMDKEVYNSGENSTGGHYIAENGPAPSLRADSHPPAVCVYYIVRRLTPTECARLQGFADEWAAPDHKDDFTNAECQFWQGVRDTYAEFNGKRKKLYTKAQLLKWYNGLYTDSAEYKMWGNGIALPTALYVLQGIADCLEVRNGQSK